MKMVKQLYVCTGCNEYGDEPCFLLNYYNSDRDVKHPDFCTKDGNGARWVKSTNKEATDLTLKYIEDTFNTKALKDNKELKKRISKIRELGKGK